MVRLRACGILQLVGVLLCAVLVNPRARAESRTDARKNTENLTVMIDAFFGDETTAVRLCSENGE